MKYEAPIANNKPCYVPIVVKDKSYLVGYVHAMNLFKVILQECLNKIGIKVDTSVFETCLDSTRFNDVMVNGKKASECTEAEIEKYLKAIVESKMERITENHPDNEIKVLEKAVLKIECPCGLGFYSFNKVDDIPEKPLKCAICGQTILDYTNHYDSEYEYNGKDEI